MKFELQKFSVSFRIEKRWIRFHAIPANHLTVSQHRDFILKVTPTQNGHLVLELQKDSLQPLGIEEVEYRISVPLLNFGKILIPDSGRFFMHRLFPSTVWFQTFRLETRAIGNPFFVLMDLNDRPVFAFGLLGKLVETEFEVTSPGVNPKNSLWVKQGRFRMHIRKRLQPELKVFRDGFFLFEAQDKPSTTNGGTRTGSGESPSLPQALSWWHLLRDYGRTYQATRTPQGDLDPEKLSHLTPHTLRNEWRRHFTITPRGFYPAFCTWLVLNSDRMSHEWVLAMGKKVQDLGMKAFILDDGWYGVGLDSLTPVLNIGDWPRQIPGKFSDITKTLRELRKLGLNPILWFAPLAVGPDSRILEKVKPFLVIHNGEYYRSPAGFYTLCIRNPDARAVILEHVERLISYGAGGLKVDLFDYMSTEPCEADHTHDIPTIADAMEVLLKEIFYRARSRDPEILISVTNNHANVHLVRYSSCVRGGDSPYDPNMLMLRSLYPAAYTPAVHNDYALWTRYESPKSIAHILIRQIFAGVPNFTVDFLSMPDVQNQVVRAWLHWFNQQIDLYREGDFEPLNSSLTVWRRRFHGTQIITVLPPATEIPLLEPFETLYILNGTDRTHLRVKQIHPDLHPPFEAEVLDHTLQNGQQISLRGLEEIPAQEAGLTVIRKRRS